MTAYRVERPCAIGREHPENRETVSAVSPDDEWFVHPFISTRDFMRKKRLIGFAAAADLRGADRQ